MLKLSSRQKDSLRLRRHPQHRYVSIFDNTGKSSIIPLAQSLPVSYESVPLSVLVISKKSNGISIEKLHNIIGRIVHKKETKFRLTLIYNSKNCEMTESDVYFRILKDRVMVVSTTRSQQNKEPEILLEESYHISQKLFLHANNHLLLLFISRTGERFVFSAKDPLFSNVILNTFITFSQFHFKIRSRSTLATYVHLLVPEQQAGRIEGDIGTSHLLSKYKLKANDLKKNKKNPLHSFEVTLYNSSEVVVGFGKLFLYENYFGINFNLIKNQKEQQQQQQQQKGGKETETETETEQKELNEKILKIQRKYSIYSKIFSDLNDPTFCRFNFDENNYINISFVSKAMKDQFVKEFKIRKHQFSRGIIEDEINIFKIQIQTKNGGIIDGHILIKHSCFIVKTKIQNLYYEYLPRISINYEQKNKKNEKNFSKQSIVLELGKQTGFLKLFFSNSIEAKDFCSSFKDAHQRYIAGAISQPIRALRAKVNGCISTLLLTNLRVTILKFKKTFNMNQNMKQFGDQKNQKNMRKKKGKKKAKKKKKKKSQNKKGKINVIDKNLTSREDNEKEVQNNKDNDYGTGNNSSMGKSGDRETGSRNEDESESESNSMYSSEDNLNFNSNESFQKKKLLKNKNYFQTISIGNNVIVDAFDTRSVQIIIDKQRDTLIRVNFLNLSRNGTRNRNTRPGANSSTNKNNLIKKQRHIEIEFANKGHKNAFIIFYKRICLRKSIILFDSPETIKKYGTNVISFRIVLYNNKMKRTENEAILRLYPTGVSLSVFQNVEINQKKKNEKKKKNRNIYNYQRQNLKQIDATIANVDFEFSIFNTSLLDLIFRPNGNLNNEEFFHVSFSNPKQKMYFIWRFSRFKQAQVVKYIPIGLYFKVQRMKENKEIFDKDTIIKLNDDHLKIITTDQQYFCKYNKLLIQFDPKNLINCTLILNYNSNQTNEANKDQINKPKNINNSPNNTNKNDAIDENAISNKNHTEPNSEKVFIKFPDPLLSEEFLKILHFLHDTIDKTLLKQKIIRDIEKLQNSSLLRNTETINKQEKIKEFKVEILDQNFNIVSNGSIQFFPNKWEIKIIGFFQNKEEFSFKEIDQVRITPHPKKNKIVKLEMGFKYAFICSLPNSQSKYKLAKIIIKMQNDFRSHINEIYQTRSSNM
ncbi:transcription initiation factor tfiid subunit [Anaeramoeba flamelloides]|uniref:Transcription initiation factor tfiid subunit n=1 Tax=Anaeramoeba flamelloides TaxID=1746091 RepID=A0AAV7Z0S0_9EUKA|nr:transcription initiation factor tfiid subunit [Anaeramoeba flamelloides]